MVYLKRCVFGFVIGCDAVIIHTNLTEFKLSNCTHCVMDISLNLLNDDNKNKYTPRNPNRRAVEKKVANIEAHYMKRAKNSDDFAAGKNFNPFLSAYKFYGINVINSLIVGDFGKVNEGWKQLICCLAKVAVELQ